MLCLGGKETKWRPETIYVHIRLGKELDCLESVSSHTIFLQSGF